MIITVNISEPQEGIKTKKKSDTRYRDSNTSPDRRKQ